MSVNTNFYATINDLVAQATEGSAATITDYKSFIDVGEGLATMAGTDFSNAFIGALMNKVKLAVDTARSYEGKYKKLIRGQMSPNGVIEMITHTFYETKEAVFANLSNGTGIDQYVIAKPVVDVDYFVKDNAYQIILTIQALELEGAWKTPEAMSAFIDKTILYMVNSNELAREAGRLGLIADTIVDCNDETAATSTEAPAVKYDLLALYNDIAGTKLTTDNCLYNEGFIRFACAQIRKVSDKLSNVSESYNLKGNKTFTPDSDKDVFVSSAFVGAMNAYVRPYPGNTEVAVIPSGFETVPYWQNEADPLVVTLAATTQGGTATKTDPVICVIADKFAMGEYVCHEQLRTSPFNARGEYYDNFLNVQTKLVRNLRANTVIFTIAGE